mmetsp:Transcript_55014/g.174937  ORF Transcript_55014/g.174937 Transcript_55014/m.174937 type:complete len:251 (+) Transcript_55014:115-867(+)
MVARALLALWARSATAWLLLARRAPQVPSPPPPGRRGAPPAPRGPQRSAWRLPARASADACPGSLHPTPLWGRRARPAPLGARAEAGRRPRLQSRGWRRSPGGGAPPASTPAHAGCVKAVVPLRGAAWRARGARCAPGARMATSAWAWTAAPVRGAGRGRLPWEWQLSSLYSMPYARRLHPASARSTWHRSICRASPYWGPHASPGPRPSSGSRRLQPSSASTSISWGHRASGRPPTPHASHGPFSCRWG